MGAACAAPNSSRFEGAGVAPRDSAPARATEPSPAAVGDGATATAGAPAAAAAAAGSELAVARSVRALAADADVVPSRGESVATDPVRARGSDAIIPGGFGGLPVRSHAGGSRLTHAGSTLREDAVGRAGIARASLDGGAATGARAVLPSVRAGGFAAFDAAVPETRASSDPTEVCAASVDERGIAGASAPASCAFEPDAAAATRAGGESTAAALGGDATGVDAEPTARSAPEGADAAAVGTSERGADGFSAAATPNSGVGSRSAIERSVGVRAPPSWGAQCCASSVRPTRSAICQVMAPNAASATSAASAACLRGGDPAVLRRSWSCRPSEHARRRLSPRRRPSAP